MTRIDKSDAQLDAEAAKRRDGAEWTPDTYGTDFGYRAVASPVPPVAPRSSGIQALIEDHQGMRRDDAFIDRMVGRQPPSTRDPNTGMIRQHDATAVGMNMSARLFRYVESPPPAEFPWQFGFKMLRVWCRRWHHYHARADTPFWRGSLCQEAVRLVVIGPEKRIKSLPEGPLSVRQAGYVLRYTDLEPILRTAFAFIEQTMDESRARAVLRAREDEGHFTIYDKLPEHHIPSEAHIKECPNPVCRARRAA